MKLLSKTLASLLIATLLLTNASWMPTVKAAEINKAAVSKVILYANGSDTDITIQEGDTIPFKGYFETSDIDGATNPNITQIWEAFLNYGDGEDSSKYNVLPNKKNSLSSHSYKYAGTYTASLNIEEHTGHSFLGQPDTDTIKITVKNKAPKVSLTPSSATIYVNNSKTIKANASGGNPGYSYKWLNDCAGKPAKSSITFKKSTAGTYSCKVKVTDKDGDKAYATATIKVKNKTTDDTPPADEGDSNQQSENSNQPKESDGQEEVKGTLTCDEPLSVSGYVYYDSDSNQIRGETETGLSSVNISVTYINEDGETEVAAETTTDVYGYWQAELCPAEYQVNLDQNSLPTNITLESSETVALTVSEEETAEVNFIVKKTEQEESGSQFNLTWLLIILGVILVGGSAAYLVVKNRGEQEESN